MELRHIKNRSLVNFRMLVRILGWLLGIEGVFMLFPAATSAFYGESDYLPFLIVACLALFSGAVMARRSKPRFEHLGRRISPDGLGLGGFFRIRYAAVHFQFGAGVG